MTKINSQHQKQKKAKGQSLVEMALCLPLFLILIAGIVEVGNLLVQRQRITTATDMAVRFGSRGGSDEGIQLSTYAVLTQTMPIDNLALWDVFVVRGIVNDNGTGWVDGSYSVNSVYGANESDLATDLITSTYQISLGNHILDALQTRINPETKVVLMAGDGNQDGRDQAAGEEIVGVIMSYKAETILGIEDYFGEDVELVTEKYMTVHAISDQTTGCDIYPLAISNGVRNIDPQPKEGEVPGQVYYLQTSTNYQAQIEPEGNLELYNYPVNKRDRPHWDEFRTIPGLRSVLPDEQGNNFALEGDIYILNEGAGFKWVFFGNDIADSTTAKDMAWPGNSRIYDGYNIEFLDLTPGEGLHVGDRIKHSTGANADRAVGALQSIEPHIDVGRSIRVPVINLDDFNNGEDHFKIGGFAIIKILGYGTSGTGDRFIVTEVVKYDTSCGQISR